MGWPLLHLSSSKKWRMHWPAPLFAWTHCYQTSLFFLCFLFPGIKAQSIFKLIMQTRLVQRRGHKHHVSTLWMATSSLIRKHSDLTAGAHDLMEWTHRRVKNLALSLTWVNNISKYSSPRWAKIRVALYSVKLTNCSTTLKPDNDSPVRVGFCPNRKKNTMNWNQGHCELTLFKMFPVRSNFFWSTLHTVVWSSISRKILLLLTLLCQAVWAWWEVDW